MSFVARKFLFGSRRSHRLAGSTRLLAAMLVAATSACGSSDPAETDSNVLPTQGATEDDSSSTAAPTTMTMTMTSADSTGGTGGELPLPVAYRFECIDIQALGDADGTAFQASLLEDTWSSDVDDYKLNIIFEVVSRDAAAATGEVAIRSGIGTGAADMCAEQTSQSEVIAVEYSPTTALWAPATGDGACSAPADAGTADPDGHDGTARHPARGW